MGVNRFAAAVVVAGAIIGAGTAHAVGMGADDARHLLSRTTFGPVVPQVKSYSFLTREQAVNQLLAESGAAALVAPPPWVKEPPTSLRALRTASVEERRKMLQFEARRVLDLKAWWVAELLSSPAQLTERMTLFWHGHFTSSQQKVRVSHLLYQQNQLLRRHALGNFGEMLKAVSKDPAMLIYLDSASNRRGQPNENFAREVMELFTLGEGHYGEADVREAARAFTGWSVDPDTGEFLWRAQAHDAGLKTVLGQSGALDGHAVLEILLRQPRTATHVVEKLWREFISAQPDPAEVRRIADAFRASNYEIRVALRELFRSPAFWSADSRGTLVKSPADLVIGTVRQLELTQADPLSLAMVMANLGQNLFAPPNVKGWPGGTKWINSGTLLARKQFVDQVFSNGEPGSAGVRLAEAPAAAAVGPLAREVRERVRRSMGEIRFDSEKWLAHFPVMLAGDGDAVRRVVLAGEPAGGLPAYMANRELVRLLALDPMYQVK